METLAIPPHLDVMQLREALAKAGIKTFGL